MVGCGGIACLILSLCKEPLEGRRGRYSPGPGSATIGQEPVARTEPFNARDLAVLCCGCGEQLYVAPVLAQRPLRCPHGDEVFEIDEPIPPQ